MNSQPKRSRNKGKLTCAALRRARHTPAARMAKRAVMPAVTPPARRIEKTLERMTTKTFVDHDGIERYVSTTTRAAEMLADAILLADKRCGKTKPHAGAKVGRAFIIRRKRAHDVPDASTAERKPRKRWGIYPLAQNGARGDTPVLVVNTQSEAQARCNLLAQWGNRQFVVCDVSEVQ